MIVNPPPAFPGPPTMTPAVAACYGYCFKSEFLCATDYPAGVY
jgi:hypothetical protein